MIASNIAGMAQAKSSFVFVNCCGPAEVAQRLHRECGVPVVMGWRDVTVPAQQCLSMVRTYRYGGLHSELFESEARGLHCLAWYQHDHSCDDVFSQQVAA